MFNEIKEYSLTIKYFLEENLLSEEQLFVLEYVINTFPEPMLYLGKGEDKEPVYNEDIILLLILLSFVIGQSREKINNLENAQDIETLLDIVKSGEGNNLKNNEILLALLASNLNILDQIENIDTEKLLKEVKDKETLLRSQFKLLTYRGTKFSLDELFKIYGKMNNITIGVEDTELFKITTKVGTRENPIEEDKVLLRTLLALKPAGVLIEMLTSELPQLSNKVRALVNMDNSTIDNYDHGWRPYLGEKDSNGNYFAPDSVVFVNNGSTFQIKLKNYNREILKINSKINVEFWLGGVKQTIPSELTDINFATTVESVSSVNAPAFSGLHPKEASTLVSAFNITNNTVYQKVITSVELWFSEIGNPNNISTKKTIQLTQNNIIEPSSYPSTYIAEPFVVNEFPDTTKNVFLAEIRVVNTHKEPIKVAARAQASSVSSPTYIYLETEIEPLKVGTVRMIDSRLSPTLGLSNTVEKIIGTTFMFYKPNQTSNKQEVSKQIAYKGLPSNISTISSVKNKRVSMEQVAEWTHGENYIDDNFIYIKEVYDVPSQSFANYKAGFNGLIKSFKSIYNPKATYVKTVGSSPFALYRNGAFVVSENLVGQEISMTSGWSSPVIYSELFGGNPMGGNYKVEATVGGSPRGLIKLDDTFSYLTSSNETIELLSPLGEIDTPRYFEADISITRGNLIKPILSNIACSKVTGNLTATVQNNNPQVVDVMSGGVKRDTIAANSSKTVTFATYLTGTLSATVTAYFSDPSGSFGNSSSASITKTVTCITGLDNVV